MHWTERQWGITLRVSAGELIITDYYHLTALGRAGDTDKAGLGQAPELTLMVTARHMIHTRGPVGAVTK